jgi:hypothetical protein
MEQIFLLNAIKHRPDDGYYRILSFKPSKTLHITALPAKSDYRAMALCRIGNLEKAPHRVIIDSNPLQAPQFLFAMPHIQFACASKRRQKALF